MKGAVSADGAILPTMVPTASSMLPACAPGELIGEGKPVLSQGPVAPRGTHCSAGCNGSTTGDEGAWGLSAAVDLQDCLPDSIRSRGHIKAYVIALCELIGMKRYGDCRIVHFGEGRVAGYSMIQLIETSLISGHFANDTNRAYLDIFSCKGYDPAVVEAFSKQFFGARSSSVSVTLRY